MKLPNAERAFVTQEKIRDYLLNAAHPENGGKAAFFMALGFRAEDWPALAASLVKLPETRRLPKPLKQSTDGSIL